MREMAAATTTWIWRLGGLGLVLATGLAHACKYNVRDAGFVDFEPAPYRLVVVTNLEPAARDWQQELRHVATTTWLDANVELELVNPLDPPAEVRAARRFAASRTEPAAVLVAPDGRTFLRPFVAEPDQDAIWSLVEGTVDSPLRRRLAETLVNSFAAIIVAEGPDAGENERVREAAAGAVRRFADRMGRLPKPVKAPPVVFRVPLSLAANQGGRQEAYGAADEVALWSLGLSATNRSETEVAVVYGRGRRSGPPLRGPELTETALLDRLTILGQDCECDLDRSWLRGPLMPMRWDAEQQQQVVKELGFDAENPMVKTEIARIVARGPTPGARRVTFEQRSSDPLGYSEISVDGGGATGTTPASQAEPELASSIEGPPAATNLSTGTAGGAPAGGKRPVGRLSITMLGLLGFGVLGVLWVFFVSGRSR